jgi:hypothetical protein
VRTRVSGTFINLLGLGIGGAGNAFFLYLALSDSDSNHKAFVLSTWSGIFLAGAFLSSFETYQLITSVKKNFEGRASSVVSISLFLFLILGLGQFYRWTLDPVAVPILGCIGALNGISISARASAAAKRDFRSLATANFLDGALRFFSILAFQLAGLKITTTLILICYIAGNLGATIALHKNISLSSYSTIKSFIPNKLDINLIIAGGCGAISSGGLPLIATYIHGQEAELLVVIAVFTFSRMFLILQTVTTYQNPKFIEMIGTPWVTPKLLLQRLCIPIFFALISPLIYLTGFLTPKPTSVNEIIQFIFLGTGIGLGVILSLVLINLQSNQKSHIAAANSVLVAATAIIIIVLITGPVMSFVVALNAAPLTALATIYIFESKRHIRL